MWLRLAVERIKLNLTRLAVLLLHRYLWWRQYISPPLSIGSTIMVLCSGMITHTETNIQYSVVVQASGTMDILG